MAAKVGKPVFVPRFALSVPSTRSAQIALDRTLASLFFCAAQRLLLSF
jgi:hypothetical protein